MAYFKTYIDETGIHVPSYQDILEDLKSSMRAIYGDDIYLENDSADYQMLSIFALKQSDVLQAVVDAYNSRSPLTATGVGLDAVVKLNGITRLSGRRSTCLVVLTGDPGAIINNGSVRDKNGTLWFLPKIATIGGSGSSTYTVFCEKEGAINAAPGDLSSIGTPTAGWKAVVNEAAAVPGALEEKDAELRRRQTLSVAGPSRTLLDGTRAAIAAIPNVSRFAVYENDTNTNDSNGIPGHIVYAVVEGGDENLIAEAILNHKGIGCGTGGSTRVFIKDKAGYTNTIRFFRPETKQITISVTLRPYAGYVDDSTRIKEAIKTYIDNLEIGANVSVSMLAAIIINCNPDILHPTFGIRRILLNDSAADIQLTFRSVAGTELSDITVE